jgi:hypothetical protein
VNAEYGTAAVIDAAEAQHRVDLAVVAARARYAEYHDWQGFTWADYEAAQQLGQGHE